MIVSFTGTRYGMSDAQLVAVENLLDLLRPAKAVHGCCVGSDADFDALCKRRGIPRHGWPGDTPGMRADCNCETMEPPRGNLQRNVIIAKMCAALIATPLEATDPGKGGTWHAIRQARKIGKRVYIVNRDGEVEVITEKENQ